MCGWIRDPNITHFGRIGSGYDFTFRSSGLNRQRSRVGSVQKSGALGAIKSVYFNDPDGNLIEVSQYLPAP